MKILLLDNFDSFTYNLADYLQQAGATCCIIRNDTTLDEIIQDHYQGIVLSPGPSKPSQAGCMREVIEYYYQQLPILGICLGHQALGEFFGAQLTKAAQPMHGKLSRIYCQVDELFNTLPTNFQVVRYHSLVLQNVNKPLKVIASTQTNEVMAIRHFSLPIWGVQFHPEAFLTSYGLQIIKNWLALVESTVDIS